MAVIQIRCIALWANISWLHYLGLRKIFTSFNYPKDNADTERLMQTIKENLVWPYEWENPYQFEAALKDLVK